MAARNEQNPNTRLFRKTALALAIPAAIAGLSAPLPAQAQIEEVIVTATRRAESVQDIPVNIVKCCRRRMAALYYLE